jgi:HKD family nuclease
MAEYCFYPNLAECLDKVRKDNIAAVDIAVAYIKKSGLEYLKTIGLLDMMRCIQTRIITSPDFMISEIDAVALLKESGINIRAIKLREGEFHPKVYIFRYKDGTAHAIIGSSNLSIGAVAHNIEANILIYGDLKEDIFYKLNKFFEDLWKISVELDEKAIATLPQGGKKVFEDRATSTSLKETRELPLPHRTFFYLSDTPGFVIVEVTNPSSRLLTQSHPISYEQLLAEFERKMGRMVEVEEKNYLKILCSGCRVLCISLSDIIGLSEQLDIRTIYGTLDVKELINKVCETLMKTEDNALYVVISGTNSILYIYKSEDKPLDSFKIFNISHSIARPYLRQILEKLNLQIGLGSEAYVIAKCIVYRPIKGTRELLNSDPNLIMCANKWQGETKRKAFWYAVGLALCAFRYGGHLLQGPTRLARGYEVGKGHGTVFKSRNHKNKFAKRFAKELSSIGYLIVEEEKYQANLPLLTEKGFYETSTGLLQLSIKMVKPFILEVEAKLLRPFKMRNTILLGAGA